MDLLLVFEELHGSLVSLGFLTGREGSQIPALPSLAVEFSRIQAVLTRLQFPNHGNPSMCR